MALFLMFALLCISCKAQTEEWIRLRSQYKISKRRNDNNQPIKRSLLQSGQTSEDCDNVPPPGAESCDSITMLGACSSDLVIDGGYCRLACERCEEVSSQVSPVVESEVPPANSTQSPVLARVPFPSEPLSTPIPTTPEVPPLDNTPSPPLLQARQYVSVFEDPDRTVPQELRELPATASASVSECRSPDAISCDVEALIAFKNSLTLGQQLLSSWKGSNPCSGWEYVGCGSVEGSQRVVDLSLFDETGFISYSFIGNLVPEFSKISYLEQLDLIEQNLTSSIPPELSVLVDLEILDVSLNEFTGLLPVEFSTLTNLQVFAMGGNQLTGSLYKEYSVLEDLEVFFPWIE
eukprot:TRINITY_DN994_c1_g1_i4.p1 TRINITY_DN994_c1_g1~~TRINITY_DN994_c1_g1_i4.p1  ORF type:complete len:377 (-),score=39.22 TRINITY_DN994_c1_g1_i4:1035-2081(-)